SLYAIAVSPGESGRLSVSRPLYGIQIDAFLDHLPQRGQFAQLADALTEQVDREVDFLDGGKATDREADRAVRQFVVATQCAQHVGRLQTGRGTRRARRHGDILDRHDQRLAFDI